jgi:hypothetical protein
VPKFDLKQSPALKKHLDTRMRKAELAAVQGAALQVIEDIQTRLIPGARPPPVDRGVYRAGWRMRPKKWGAEIANAVPHAGFIEDGVRGAHVKPGRKMIDALAAWAKRKGIVKGKGKGVAVAARGMAFAIAQSMRKKGIFNRGKGFGILRRALLPVQKYIQRELKAEIAKAFR